MKYYTVKEIASTIRVHPYTIRRWTKEGKVKGMKVGRKWLFDNLDVFLKNPAINLSVDKNDPIVSAIQGDNPQS